MLIAGLGELTVCPKASKCFHGSSQEVSWASLWGRPSHVDPVHQACNEQTHVPSVCDTVLGPAAVPGASSLRASCQAGSTNGFIFDKGELFGRVVVFLGVPNPWNNCCDKHSNHLQ